jgi:hypothetical protein
MRRRSLKPLKTFLSCKIVNHLHTASISTDRRAALRLWEVKPKASIPSVAPRLTRAFHIRPQLFVLSFCQFSRNSFPPLRIEEAHILAIDLLAFFCCRIRARNVEFPVLHEVVNRYSRRPPFSDLQTARCSLSAGHRARHSMGGGLDLFEALFKIPGRVEWRPTNTQPQDDERDKNQRDRQCKMLFGAVRKTVHALDPTDPSTRCSKYGLLRASMFLDVATQPQPAGLFIVANSRHY